SSSALFLSRRRWHTRSKRDWSSDVCSSDLPVLNRSFSLPRRLNSASYTTDLLCESVLEFTEADCAIINAGLIVKEKSGNELTEFDIHQMLPHPINTATIDLKGTELKQIIYKAMEQSYIDEVAIGFGFRGDIFGGYVFKNIG